jgi:hypothetical protein
MNPINKSQNKQILADIETWYPRICVADVLTYVVNIDFKTRLGLVFIFFQYRQPSFVFSDH